eukprot:CAMPEP_0179272576 /NCGR_PEP_ID=MMETSP0797-20121207/32573_1 /TAXON_ID=47934 /ORGANISM="Dinophysis acuminata, Strain DAEP01" /LENGTH=250 /DNA_ID=CAMNT_0020980985 /DNA_START=59 /DNA_END=811 /DNA_ORIENTATION=-
MMQPGVAAKTQEEQAIVERVKALQRSDPAGKQTWWEYCDAYGEGVRDPGRHSAAFLLKFMEGYQGGHLAPTQPAAAAGEQHSQGLVDLIKEGQRRSQHWKATWATYCMHYGGGINDPAKHKQAVLVGFLDFLGQHGAIAGSGPAMPSMMAVMPPPADGERLQKRPRVGAPMMQQLPAPGMMPAPGGMMAKASGGPEKESLVNRIKAYQRQGELQKVDWGNFCDKNHGGVRDPARHDLQVLQQFALHYSVP